MNHHYSSPLNKANPTFAAATPASKTWTNMDISRQSGITQFPQQAMHNAGDSRSSVMQCKRAPAGAPSRSGDGVNLPAPLQTGLEQLSGYAMNDVSVHYNSKQPSEIGAHAFAQNNQIHLGPGQQQHLAHEAWHIVQQKQGRVSPTMQMPKGAAINSSETLEHEADVMGAKAQQWAALPSANVPTKSLKQASNSGALVMQRMLVNLSDIGKDFNVNNNGTTEVATLKSIGAGWYKFELSDSSEKSFRQGDILSRASAFGFPISGSSNATFMSNGLQFPVPTHFDFSTKALDEVVKPIPKGLIKKKINKNRGTGVRVGDIGSYRVIQYLEKAGDKLTGDHQPSGAAIKEAIRVLLHSKLNRVLTRGMAKNAYGRAQTIVVTDKWHKKTSRTYGGRNTKGQIAKDAANLVTAAIDDWGYTVQELKSHNISNAKIQQLWTVFNKLRAEFFLTGSIGYSAYN